MSSLVRHRNIFWDTTWEAVQSGSLGSWKKKPNYTFVSLHFCRKEYFSNGGNVRRPKFATKLKEEKKWQHITSVQLLQPFDKRSKKPKPLFKASPPTVDPEHGKTMLTPMLTPAPISDLLWPAVPIKGTAPMIRRGRPSHHLLQRLLPIQANALKNYGQHVKVQVWFFLNGQASLLVTSALTFWQNENKQT